MWQRMWERNKLNGTVDRMCTKYTVIKYRRKDVKGRKKDSKMKTENYEDNKELKKKGDGRRSSREIQACGSVL